MYHCPECGEMVLAGMEHPDYSILEKADMPQVNGFKYYLKDKTCPYCGAAQTGDPEAKPGDYPDDFGGYALECPQCCRDGCEECMPCGRGCTCPECEEGAND